MGVRKKDYCLHRALLCIVPSGKTLAFFKQSHVVMLFSIAAIGFSHGLLLHPILWLPLSIHGFKVGNVALTTRFHAQHKSSVQITASKLI